MYLFIAYTEKGIPTASSTSSVEDVEEKLKKIELRYSFQDSTLPLIGRPYTIKLVEVNPENSPNRVKTTLLRVVKTFSSNDISNK